MKVFSLVLKVDSVEQCLRSFGVNWFVCTPPLCVITNTFIRTAGSCWFSMKGLTVALCLFKGIEAGKPC